MANTIRCAVIRRGRTVATASFLVIVLSFAIAVRAAGPATLTFTGGPTDGAAGIATDAAIAFTANTSLGGMTTRTTSTWERRDPFGGQAFTGTTAPTARTIDFPTSTVGYVVGRSGGAVKTTDGGTTWMTLTTGTTVHLNEVECVHATLCWIVGESGTIRKTTDGGLTWSAQTSGTTQRLRGIAMASATIGWAFGGNGQNPGEAIVLRTTDGGTTWTSQTVPNYPFGGPARTFVNGIAVVNMNTAWIIADGILKTTNGGTTWTVQTIPDSASPSAIAAVDTNTAIVVGDSGLVVKTTNGGTTWTAQTSGTTVSLGDITMSDASTAWVVGTGGTMVKTTNGGTTWTAQTSGTTSDFIAIHAISSSVVWAAAATIGMELRTTSDGGTTWRSAALPIQGTYAAPAIAFINSQQGWIVGDRGVVYGTSDGGRTWRYLPSGTTQRLRGAHFVNATTGWVVGDNKVVRKTTDGGVTWTAQTAITADLDNPDEVIDIACLDANTCWLVGAREADGGADSASVYKTTNGGTTWAKQSTNQTTSWLFDVEIVDANTVYVVGSGGAVLKTTNGGTTWTAQTLSMSDPNSNALIAVDCTSATRCRAGGGAGNFFDTTDGTTWAGPLSVGVTDQIQDIAYTDANTGWFITIGGTLRRTTNDGSTWSTETTGFLGTDGDALAAVDGASAVLALGGSNEVRRMESNITLRANAGNARSGTPSDVNTCSRFTHSADILTCEHAALDSGTWYTFTIGTGISLSGYELASAVTRSFRTAFATGQAFDLAATDLASLASEAYLTVSGSATAATQATFGAIIRSTVATADGTARVTVPQSAALTRNGGGTFDTTALAFSDYTATATEVRGTKQAVVQFGAPNVALASDAAITIAMPIPSTVAEGTVLTVYRDLDGDFSNASELTTCTVTSATCTFTTTSLSYFAAAIPGAPTVSADTTPPGTVTSVVLSGADGKVTATWQDPADADLASVIVFRNNGGTSAIDASSPRTIAKGAQRFIDLEVKAGETYAYLFRTMDKSGNVTNSTPYSVTVSAPTSGTVAPSTTITPDQPPLDTTPPGVVTDITRSGADGATLRVLLTWKDPTDVDFAAVEVYRNDGGDTPIATASRARVEKGVQRYEDTAVQAGSTYVFRLRSVDAIGNWRETDGITVAVIAEPTPEDPAAQCPTIGPLAPQRRTAVDSNIVADAQLLTDGEPLCIARVVGRDRDLVAEEVEAARATAKVLLAQPLPAAQRSAIIAFLAYGTPTTLGLGAGERGAVLTDYTITYRTLPLTLPQWRDVVLIANGRFPATPLLPEEAEAIALFRTIYLRDPVIRYAPGAVSVLQAESSADRNAIIISAYGLRQRNRNRASERIAVRTFLGIFAHGPRNTKDWDAVRVIAYSGAKR